jgi:amino-acid N-acetyltransferase
MLLVIETAQETDIPALLALLQQSSLPIDGLRDHLSTVLVAREDEGVVGSAALECFGSVALLRSVAVVATKRDHGLGKRFTEAALEVAQARGITEVYLLTETAQHYFSRFGFHAIPRQAVVPAIHQSVEWTSACLETAQAMCVKLRETRREIAHDASSGEAPRVPR